MEATRALLADGEFHESTVEQVAERAGISRATVYQHFRSRLDLVDAICDTFAENPALLAVRESVELFDVAEALETTIADCVRFWSSEESILRQLYGAAAVDPAASDLVERQLADRRSEMERLIGRLSDAERLAAGLSRRQALATLLMLTSFGTYQELRQEGLSDAKLTELLCDAGRALLTD
jgi:AcrR family transcriptional regulator